MIRKVVLSVCCFVFILTASVYAEDSTAEKVYNGVDAGLTVSAATGNPISAMLSIPFLVVDIFKDWILPHKEHQSSDASSKVEASNRDNGLDRVSPSKN